MKKKIVNKGRFTVFILFLVALIALAAYFVPKLFKKCEHEHGEDGLCVLCGEEYPHDYVEGYCTMCGGIDPDFVFPDVIYNFSLACGGDVMAHGSNIYGAYKWDGSYFYNPNKAVWPTQYWVTDGSFDFSDNYQYISEYVKKADVAMVNFETTFSGGNEYSGYWGAFNAPDSLADAVKNAGFDVAITCNNHSLDYGNVDGLKRTVGVLRDKGFTVVGSRKDTSENRSSIIEVNNVKIGIVAYTYETSSYESGGHSLNGSYMSDTAVSLLNTFRFAYGSGLACDADKAAIAKEIAWCKENGANVIVAYFHWDSTNEYVLKVTNLERDLAKFAAKEGADIIFGSHPHRVQELEVLSLTDNDGKEKTVPVYYSLGNFISNQRQETMGGDPWDDVYATEQEILAYLEVSYNATQDTVSFEKISAIPIYVDKFNTTEYRIYPLVGDYGRYDELQNNGNRWRADKALTTLTNIIGSEYIYR